MIFKGMKKLRRQIVAGLTLAIALGAPAVKAEEGQDNTGLQQVSAESVQAGALPELPARHKWTLGSEIDALPFAMNGYYGSGFMGRNGWKLRYVVARSTTPAFMVTDGFKDKRTDAYALLADRFVGARRQTLEGFWIGGGGELPLG